jgi:hypothetical protein
MPMVLMSGVTAARSVLEDAGVRTIDEPLPVAEDGPTPITRAASGDLEHLPALAGV